MKKSKYACSVLFEQGQNYYCKPIATIIINLFANLSLAADSDYYTNKLCKFLRGTEKLEGPVFGLRTLGKISLGGP